MSTIVARANYTSDSNPFTLSTGSQSGRAVVVMGKQFRDPPDMSTATLNGVPATLVETKQGTSATDSRIKTLMAYWLDADLPGTPGDYTLVVNSGSHIAFEVSGWFGETPETIEGELAAADWTSPKQISFATATPDALMFLVAGKIGGNGWLEVTGQTEEPGTNDGVLFTTKDDVGGDGFVVADIFAGSESIIYSGLVLNPGSLTDYTIRKGATAVPITHTLTAGGITSQTFNGETVALASQSGQIANVDFTDTITTSGVYTLTLGDGTNTENFDVQYNVIGLSSNILKKEGVVLANLTNVEVVIMTGGYPPRTILEQFQNITTDAAGNTGNIIIPNTLATVDENVNVFLKSFSEDVGIAYGVRPEVL